MLTESPEMADDDDARGPRSADARPAASRNVFGAAWRRLRRSPAARSVLYAFGLTRLVVFVVLVLGTQINIIMTGDGTTTREMHLQLGKIQLARLLRDAVLKADVNWYYGVAAEGYEQRPSDSSTHHNWAFFPAFPLAWRAASALTGEMALTGILLSNVIFLLALFFVYGVARESGLDEWAADRAVFYLAAYPASYFYSLPLTESMFLAVAAACLYAGRRRLWWLAGCLGALASATRVVGVLLMPVLFLLDLQTYGRAWRRASVLWLCLVPAGLLAFMLHLYAVTGDAFAFRSAVAAWGRAPGFFLSPLLSYLSEPSLIAVPWDFRLLNFFTPVLALVCGAVLLRRRQWALGAFTILIVAVALSTHNSLHSQARYAMVAFPLYFVLASAARTRPRLDQTIAALSLTLLALLTALLAANFSMVMA